MDDQEHQTNEKRTHQDRTDGDAPYGSDYSVWTGLHWPTSGNLSLFWIGLSFTKEEFSLSTQANVCKSGKYTPSLPDVPEWPFLTSTSPIIFTPKRRRGSESMSTDIISLPCNPCLPPEQTNASLAGFVRKAQFGASVPQDPRHILKPLEAQGTAPKHDPHNTSK